MTNSPFLTEQERTTLLEMQEFAKRLYTKASTRANSNCDGESRRDAEHRACEAIGAYAGIVQIFQQEALAQQRTAEPSKTPPQSGPKPPAPH